MSFRTLMQAGPAKVNELFTKLSDTSDGAVKTREKLFTELKTELELHASLEEQHLFPLLRRNAETKELVGDAIKDNKDLRAKLAELEALPKNDEAFPERLKELQKTFRQHARDEKRELLPAVQRALSEEQVQGIADKIEAGVTEAERIRHEETEARRLKARQEREEAEREAQRRAEAERVQNEKAAQARHEEAEQKRAKLRQESEEAERQAAQEAAAKQAQDEIERRAHDAAETVARTATAVPSSVLRMAQGATTNAQRVGAEIQSLTGTYIDTLKTMVPDIQTVTALPKVTVGAMTDIRAAWIEWMGKTTQMSQQLFRQAAEQQQRFAADAVSGWMVHNARIMQVAVRAAQESFQPLGDHLPSNSAKSGMSTDRELPTGR